MEKAILIMDYLNISQKAGSTFSHKGDKAIDISGKDTGIDNLKAPFTGTIKKIYKEGNAVWLESNDKVMYADGTIDYMTVLTIHDNDVSDLYVGKVIKQGEIYYSEGTRGYATGNHIHIAIGKGKFTGSGWYKNSDNVWCINNQIDIYKGLYLYNKTNIINDGGYNWIKTDMSIISNISNDYIIYTVINGDNLTKISRMYNTSIETIVKDNNIKNKDIIYVGQKLKIRNNIKYFNQYTGNSKSIVEALKSIGEISTYQYRSKIANINNIKNYIGSANQNLKLLELLKQDKLIKP